MILYNYASLIARKIPVPQEKQINFTTLQIYNHYNTIDLGVVRLATNIPFSEISYTFDPGIMTLPEFWTHEKLN